MFHRISTTLVFTLIVAIAGTGGASAADRVVEAADPVPGSYIVILRPGVARAQGSTSDLPEVDQVAAAIGRRHSFHQGHLFRRVVQGFVARTDRTTAASLAVDPRVARVEEDARVRPAQATQIAPSWGLDRIDQRPPSLDGLYRSADDGAGVHVFVVDSGIRSTHTEFTGRLDTVDAFTAISDGRGTEDCLGHGTMVSSLVAGSNFGVAKRATLHPVRVLGCDGTGTASDLIAAVDWIAAVHARHQKGSPAGRWRSVINLSLAVGGAPSSLNQAIYGAIDDGITVVASAGNSGVDRCGLLTPVLGLAEVVTVAASDGSDTFADFSDYGPCVDFAAPGVSVQAAFIRSDTDSVTASGTSMSTAYASGVAALVLAAMPDADPDRVQRVLQAYATAGVLEGVPAGTPNRLLYSYFHGDGVDESPVPVLDAACRQRQHDCVFDAERSFDDGEIVEFQWDFGDGDTATARRGRTRHNYSVVGTYTVTLTVVDGAGNRSRVERTVELH